MKRIGLISDTHSYLDPAVKGLFESCDEIWHAGDIGDIKITDTLASWKPLRAVYGNIDGGVLRVQFPEYQYFELEGVKILILHIAGALTKYNTFVQKIVAKHGKPDILICGHSHILKVVKDPVKGWLYMNPGAAGMHGFHKMRTCLRFTLSEGRPHNLEVIELGLRGKLS